MKRAAASGPTPIGLRLALASVNTSDATGSAASTNAAVAHAAAMRILRRLEAQHNEDAIHDEIAIAAKRLFRGAESDPAREPGMLSESAFYVGFAACWHVMTAINGKGGAR
jgi:hypothetical protein